MTVKLEMTVFVDSGNKHDRFEVITGNT